MEKETVSFVRSCPSHETVAHVPDKQATLSLSPHGVYQRIAANIALVIKGQTAAIKKILAAFASGGHVLLEDLPGTGKTTLAKALARSIDAQFQRIQFTPDLLPSDILGVSVFDQRDQEFHFHKGPVFTEILLADEINRAPPRTQAALLEAMGEGQVSLDGVKRPLGDLFFVIATQNPIEFHGTYPLPETQMDRFALRLSLGYVGQEEEVGILTEQKDAHPLDSISTCVSTQDVQRLRDHVRAIRVSDELKKYIVDIIASTRSAEGIQMGASPRASLALMKLAQALALFDGLDFVTPEHVQEVATPVIAHRLALDPQARFSGRTAERIVQEQLQGLSVPS